MRIVFMGSPDFAVPALEALQASSHEVVAVVSGPDKKRGRGGELSPTPVKATAQRLGIPTIDIVDTEAVNAHITDPKLRRQAPWRPLFEAFGQAMPDADQWGDWERPSDLPELKDIDLFVVVAFKVLPPAVLALPRQGAINIHASLLPKYRGAAPIHHAVTAGEKETGCTIFKLDAGVDTGGILLQERTPIGDDETTGEVYMRLAQMGASMLVPAVDLIATGNYGLQKQDASQATKAPKLRPEDEHIHLDRSSQEVHNHIRGMNPFPGAWLYLDGQRFRIRRTRNAPDITLEQGHIHQTRDAVYLGCRQGSIQLIEVQLEGRKAMDASAFFAGYRGRELRIRNKDKD